MPVKSTRTLKRPNTTVSFFKSSNEWKTYLKETYQDTGLQQSVTVTHSDGGKTATVTAVWKDQAALTAYNNDPNVKSMFLDPRDAYSSSNNIVISDWQVELI